MFSNQMLEKETNEVTIAEDTSFGTFQEFIRYIYTGSAPNLSNFPFELLDLAAMYQMEHLKVLCINELYNKVSVEDVCEVLILADRHNVEDLKLVAIKFIKEWVDLRK